MTIKAIINLLKKERVNSKGQVINMLENINKEELLELRQDINERLAIMNVKR